MLQLLAVLLQKVTYLSIWILSDWSDVSVRSFLGPGGNISEESFPAMLECFPVVEVFLVPGSHAAVTP